MPGNLKRIRITTTLTTARRCTRFNQSEHRTGWCSHFQRHQIVQQEYPFVLIATKCQNLQMLADGGGTRPFEFDGTESRLNSLELRINLL